MWLAFLQAVRSPGSPSFHTIQFRPWTTKFLSGTLPSGSLHSLPFLHTSGTHIPPKPTYLRNPHAPEVYIPPEPTCLRSLHVSGAYMPPEPLYYSPSPCCSLISPFISDPLVFQVIQSLPFSGYPTPPLLSTSQDYSPPRTTHLTTARTTSTGSRTTPTKPLQQATPDYFHKTTPD